MANPTADDRKMVLSVLPGSAKRLAWKLDLPLGRVRAQLRQLLAEGVVTRTTSWDDQHSYTWIYREAETSRSA